MEINEIDLSIDNDIVAILKKNGFNKVTWTREEIKNWLRINFNIFVDVLPLYNESDLPLILIFRNPLKFSKLVFFSIS